MQKDMQKSQKINLMGQAKKSVSVYSNLLRLSISPFLYLYLSVFLMSGVLGGGESARAEIYFYFDAEDEIVGATLPLVHGNPANFCQTECGGRGKKGTTQEIGGTPQGNNYFQ
ncbi:MAG: hypothetical protein DRP78_06015 [Candidatus Omnitrophota bacterium]|nr:MAG: hypothetical protein DRP78_06015 [Candidatus Omnitrophota bacterium]